MNHCKKSRLDPRLSALRRTEKVTVCPCSAADLLARFLVCFEKADIEGIRTILAPNAMYCMGGTGHASLSCHGRKEILCNLGKIRSRMPNPVRVEFVITHNGQETATCGWRLVAGVTDRARYENDGVMSVRSCRGLIATVEETLHLSRVASLLRRPRPEEV
jgi:hypothetical protein